MAKQESRQFGMSKRKDTIENYIGQYVMLSVSNQSTTYVGKMKEIE